MNCPHSHVSVPRLVAVFVFVIGLAAAPAGALDADRPNPPPAAARSGAILGEKASAYATAVDAVRTGFDRLRRGELDAAQQRFEKALALEPRMAPAHVGLGHVATSREQWDAALGAYEAARSAFENGFARWDYEQRHADATPDEGVNLFPSLRSPWPTTTTAGQERLLWVLQNSTGPYDVLTVEGVPAEIWFFLGNAQFRLGRVADALASWERCVALDAAFAPAYSNLALGYLKAGRAAESRAALDHAARLGLAVDPGLRAAVEGTSPASM